MSGSSAGPDFEARIDAQLLYWTRLPPEAGRTDDQQEDYRFERVLPVPIESLHIVRARLDDGGALLAGIEPERLRAHLAQRPDVTAATWALLPDRVPDHLAGSDAAAALAGLNLLHGPFEPERRRRARQRRDLAVGLGLGLALVLALVGIERQVSARAQAGEALRRQDREVLAQALGQGAGAGAGTVPNAALLTQELRRLEQAARGPAAAQLDAASVLQKLWSAWPADLRAQVETISLAPDRLVLRGSVPTLADAERVAKACPTIAAGDAVLRASPLQAEQTPRGAVFLITWYLQSAERKGGQP